MQFEGESTHSPHLEAHSRNKEGRYLGIDERRGKSEKDMRGGISEWLRSRNSQACKRDTRLGRCSPHKIQSRGDIDYCGSRSQEDIKQRRCCRWRGRGEARSMKCSWMEVSQRRYCK